jgi:type I restriction enzyme S subunit
MKKEWQTRNLGELCRIRTGKKDVNEGNPEGKFPFFTCAAEHTFSDNYSFDTEALLIAGNGDVGKVSYYKGKFEAYQRTYVLSDFAGVLPRFLYLILDGKLKDTVSKQKLGNTMPYIKVGMLTDFQLPVPPLPEQQRIVGILDEAFAGIATAKGNAEKNLQNACALFESHLQSVFTERGNGWVEKKLSAVCDLQNGYAFKSGDYIKSSNTLNIRMSSIRPGGSFDPEHNQRFLPDSYAEEYASFSLQDGDLIIAMTDMASDPKILGVPTLVGNQNGRTFLMNQRVGKLFGFSDNARVPYLRYFLTSPSIKQFYKSKGAGGLQINISKGDILSAQIPLPGVAEQDRIVEQLDELSEETQRLASLYERKLAALEALKKSLLHQAFTGNL